MKYRYSILILSIIGVFLLPHLALGYTNISGNISADTTWQGGQVYVVNGDISVNSRVTLTIEPGAIIKFNSSASLTVFGSVVANGTSGNNIYFTSIADDSVGGDTNANGASSGNAGDWLRISFASGATGNFDHTVIRFGGHNVNGSNLEINPGASVTVSNSIIAHSLYYGIFSYGNLDVSNTSFVANGLYGLYAGNGTATLTDNTFTDNGQYAVGISLNTLVFNSSGNSSSGLGNNAFVLGGDLANNQTWNDNLPYVIEPITIPSGRTLTIAPGMIIKPAYSSAYLLVNGSLNSIGTLAKPIYFTSFKDDSVGGNTNNAGGIPLGGDWNGIRFNYGSTGQISHTYIKFGGSSYYNIYSDVYINGGDVEIDNSTIASSSYYGIYSTSGSLNITNSVIEDNYYGIATNGSSTISNSAILNNSYYGLSNSSGIAEATNNYWGSSSGPTSISNPSGTGDKVSANVNFDPWLTSFPDFNLSLKEPVIIVPGIIGTELYNGNDLIWPDLSQMLFNIDGDKFITDNLDLNNDGISVQNIDAKNVIEKVLNNIPILNINIFEALRFNLEDSGYTLNQDLFYFPYDWRLNLDNSKDTLNAKIEEIKSQTGASKVNIIAHSMGGLLVDDYINNYGKNNIDKLIFIGTPHIGAPKAARTLIEGDNIGIPWLNQDRIKEVSHNSPATYELLPNNNYLNDFSGYIYKSDTNNSLNYQDSKDFLLGYGLSSNMFQLAEGLWYKNLENINLDGIDVYNIAGCSVATEAGYLFQSDDLTIDKIGRTSGDKTVPMISADYINIPIDHKFYLTKANHAEMPSQKDVRNAVVNILSGNSVNPSGNLKTDSSACKFKGKELDWKSPVAVHVYDANGNHAGPIDNNGLENNIPGVDYQIFGHYKFIFLPTDDNQIYHIVADGLATGSFDLLISENDNGINGDTHVFNDVPVGLKSRVNLNISDTSTDSEIAVDYYGEGDYASIGQSSILSPDNYFDSMPPETNALITGQAGNDNWYLGNVVVRLTASDNKSGVLSTRYSIDGSPFYTYTSSLNVSDGGMHTILYYSIDNAGNDENIKTLSFGIDNSRIEISAIFDINSSSIAFSPIGSDIDNINFSCDSSSCATISRSGNMTKLKFVLSEYGNKTVLIPEIVSYNGQESVITDTQFIVKYVEKNNVIENFDQIFAVQDMEKLNIQYDKKNDTSTITFKLIDGGKPTRETLGGKNVLQVITNNGKIGYKII